MFALVRDDELPGVVALINRAYRGAGVASHWTTEVGYITGDRTTEALLRAEVRVKPHAWQLKWQDAQGGPMRGCVWLEPLGDGVWYLGSLAVDPAQQNDGLGRTMLSAAEDWAREGGAGRIRMTVVNVRDALIAWYVRRGYRETGETEPFPYDDDRFGVPLRDDLHFVVLEKNVDALEHDPTERGRSSDADAR